ncbi:hypothetical protein ARMGADRAFT_1065944 [Armillaria gallica]|uniref:Uncharacterized protein n=1 Tax=Armillaria gallica TaxID=47427 RepID=A0A2H3DJV4_ARMGA|nr:hypothetical protein ARMGADRAFT_1065944 [Armillaria gallica]
MELSDMEVFDPWVGSTKKREHHRPANDADGKMRTKHNPLTKTGRKLEERTRKEKRKNEEVGEDTQSKKPRLNIPTSSTSECAYAAFTLLWDKTMKQYEDYITQLQEQLWEQQEQSESLAGTYHAEIRAARQRIAELETKTAALEEKNHFVHQIPENRVRNTANSLLYLFRSNLIVVPASMPATKTKSAGSSKHADFLDATNDSEYGREYTDAGSLPDHEVEYENSPVPANRGVERHNVTVSRTNRQQTWKTLSDLCGYRPRVPGEDWEHYCKRSLRKFGKALLKEATDVELEAVRLAMDKAEYAHLVLALDTTDYEVQPEERAGNWVLSNTDLGNWGLKCIEADVDCTYTNSQHLSDGECRLCSVVFAHCEGPAARKRARQSNSLSSIHSPSKKARTDIESGPSARQGGEFLSTSRFTQNLWNTNGVLGKEVMDLRHQLEAQWKTQETLENDKSALEKEVVALRVLVDQLLAESEADKKALRAVKVALAERATAMLKRRPMNKSGPISSSVQPMSRS